MTMRLLLLGLTLGIFVPHNRCSPQTELNYRATNAEPQTRAESVTARAEKETDPPVAVREEPVRVVAVARATVLEDRLGQIRAYAARCK